MNNENCWLPELVEYDSETPWIEYEKKLYEIYKQDFIQSHPLFENKIVKVRFQPRICGYEESFVHFTCKNYDNLENRMPDFRRCERIKWIRGVIENYLCKQTCSEENCGGIKIWEEPYKSYLRVYFLFEEEKFVVVLEKRESYNLLITAFYIDYEHTLRKLLKKYENFRKAKGASF